jgi:hypothetical protein
MISGDGALTCWIGVAVCAQTDVVVKPARVADTSIMDNDDAFDIPRRTASCSDGMDRGDSIVVSTAPSFKRDTLNIAS